MSAVASATASRSLPGCRPSGRVVETGAGFLADGDTVRVVDAAAAPVKSAQK